MENQSITKQWKEITVEPYRLQSGLWGYAEGDISQSYSADVFAEKKAIRTPFTHASMSYVAMSLHGKARQLEARAFPLIHESYLESIMEEAREYGDSHYVGEAVSFRRQKCVLGLPVIFKQRAYTDLERIDLLRRMYAYGGWFASQLESYSHFLLGEIEGEQRLPQCIADELAYAQAIGLESQQSLRDFIESHSNVVVESEGQQLFLL